MAVHKPRLLVLASTYPRWRGDPEPGFVHELAKRLTSEFDVSVVCPHARGAPRRETLDGVEVRRYRYAPDRWEALVNDGGIVTNLRRHPWKILLVPSFVLTLVWATWRSIAQQRPHVIHAHWLIPQGLAVALLRMIDRRVPPYLVTSHGADLFALRSRPMAQLKRFVADRAAMVTVVSAPMRDELVRIGADASKVAVEPMGVDLQHRFAPDPGQPRSRADILFVGRLVEKKGLRHLLEAMPAILAAHPDAHLTVVGFGPEEGERRAQVRHLAIQDSVHFAGAVAQDELPALYRHAAVFVAPFVVAGSGDREGLGLVVVEAAGCGCPVVVSDVPAVRQVFPDATDAVLVMPGNPAALAEGIIAVLERWAPRCEDSLRRLRDAFDWNARAGHYAALMMRIVDASSQHTQHESGAASDAHR